MAGDFLRALFSSQVQPPKLKNCAPERVVPPISRRRNRTALARANEIKSHWAKVEEDVEEDAKAAEECIVLGALLF
jgi:hypothetical protein